MMKKIQCFLSGLPTFYKDCIIFNTASTLDKAIKKDKIIYDKNKRRVDLHKTWKGRV